MPLALLRDKQIACHLLCFVVNFFFVRKIRIVGLVLVGVGLLIALTFFLIGYLKPKAAGILVETNPPASVLINGEQVGRAPYKTTRKPGEVILKLVPESFERPLAPYETKVTLVSGVETVVRREFGESNETSSGEIISFEKVGRGETSLAIVTVPDSAQIVIDAATRAFAPYKTSTIAAGEHVVAVSATGYIERTFRVKTHMGYKLTAIVNLGLSQAPVERPSQETQKEKEPPEVQILSTPVGFLRVRSEPSTLGKEIGRAEPGKSYPLLAEDEKTGWFKIEYEEGKEGWISNQYSKKVETGAAPVPTPSVTVKPTPTLTSTPTP